MKIEFWWPTLKWTDGGRIQHDCAVPCFHQSLQKLLNELEMQKYKLVKQCFVNNWYTSLFSHQWLRPQAMLWRQATGKNQEVSSNKKIPVCLWLWLRHVVIQQYNRISFDQFNLNKHKTNRTTTFKLYIKDDLFYIQCEFWAQGEPGEPRIWGQWYRRI